MHLVPTSVRGLALSLAIAALVIPPTAAAAGGATPVSTLPALQQSLATCTGTTSTPTRYALTADLVDPAADLAIPCTAVIDLNGHDLTVRTVALDPRTRLEVTDRHPHVGGNGSDDTDPQAGTLSVRLLADRDHPSTAAAIRTTGASLHLTGTAHVLAEVNGWTTGAAIGGDAGAPGGTLIARDHATVGALGWHGAGIGGGSGGAGGTTIAQDHAQVTGYTYSEDHNRDGAAIGGGVGGAGGRTIADDESSITAWAGRAGAAIGGGKGGAGGVTVANDGAIVSAYADSTGAGVGGGYEGAGGSTTVNDRALVLAAGTSLAPAVGGGGTTTGHAAGGSSTLNGGALIITSRPDLPGALLTGRVAVNAGTLVVDDDSALFVEDVGGGPGLTIGRRGTIDGTSGRPWTYGRIVGSGQIVNDGSILLPTDHVEVPVLHRHYTVRFEGVPDPVTVFGDTFTHGGRALPRTPQPPRPGVVFAGWNTRRDGTGVAIAPTSDLGRLGSAPGSAVTATAYATWRLASPTVVVRGRATEGHRLRVGVLRPDHWPSGTRLTYRWLVDGVPAGKHSRGTDFRPTARQVGKHLTVRVVARHPDFRPVVATSPPTAWVTRRRAPFVTASATVTPGGTFVVRGRGPRASTRYAIGSSGPRGLRVRGRVDADGAFRRVVRMPRVACGPHRFRVIVEGREGTPQFVVWLPITVTGC